MGSDDEDPVNKPWFPGDPGPVSQKPRFYSNGNPWTCKMGHLLYSDGSHASPTMAEQHNQTVPKDADYLDGQFVAWYRHQFELSYPDGLGFDMVKAAYIAGYNKAIEIAKDKL